MSVCVIGYCLFPLVLVAVISIFIQTVWFRAPSSLIAFAWSTYGNNKITWVKKKREGSDMFFVAALGFLSESKAHLANRRVLAVSKHAYIHKTKR